MRTEKLRIYVMEGRRGVRKLGGGVGHFLFEKKKEKAREGTKTFEIHCSSFRRKGSREKSEQVIGIQSRKKDRVLGRGSDFPSLE